MMNIKAIRTTCYTHRHSNMQIAELLLIWTSHIIVLLLYRHHTHSHYIISNIIHINLLRFVTHIISCLNFLTSVALVHKQTGKGIKQILLELISWILNIRHLKALVLTFIIPLMAVTLQALIMANLDWE